MSEADAALVQRVLDGERSAFEALVTRHIARAQAVAGAVLGNDPAVDDVVQEAFIRAYSRLGQLSKPAQFPSWLATIARNEAITWLRRQKNRRNVTIEHTVLVAPAGDADADDERHAAAQQAQMLEQALLRIKASYREIIALKYTAGLSYEDIADSLGTSVANVEKRLYRARKSLHAAILTVSTEMGIAPPSSV